MITKKNWLDKETGWIVEVDLTVKCNLACNHCNRLCNSEKRYNVKRSKLEMDEKHIDFLIQEIKKHPKGKINMIRILGGEPLLSPIINYATSQMEFLLKEKYIKKIRILTNGTIPITPEVAKYATFCPQEIRNWTSENKPANKKDVLKLKNSKHRNITVVPNDHGLPAKICNRVKTCGISYTVYGFSFTAPCTPTLLVFPENHRRYIYKIPKTYRDFIFNDFENVCRNCAFALENYVEIVKKYSINNIDKYIGPTWEKQIKENLSHYKEPNTDWIDKIKW